VLTVFLDGLKADSLEYMPFVNSFAHKARVKTQLGYSVTCHGNMYTGVYPDKHNLWFIWKRCPETSPFRKIALIKYIPFLNTLPGKLALHKFVTLFIKNTSWFGVPRIIHLPIKYWPNLDVSEKKSWPEEGYIEKYPTIFDILRQNNIGFEIVGMDKSEREESRIVEKHKLSVINPWTYLFMGDVDHFSHVYGQDSDEAIKRLKDIDSLIKRKYNEYTKYVSDFDFILFSDHGQILVEQKIDIYEIFRRNKVNLNKYFHIVDVNYLRIWVDDIREQKLLENILTDNLKGFVLTPRLLEKYHLPVNPEEYGNIVFYLDAPYVFSKTIWGYSRKMNSMHGYLPEHKESDGVFVSNRPIKKKYVNLVDILPSHLDLFNIRIPDYVDGESVWM